jgi:hypothetical protein
MYRNSKVFFMWIFPVPWLGHFTDKILFPTLCKLFSRGRGSGLYLVCRFFVNIVSMKRYIDTLNSYRCRTFSTISRRIHLSISNDIPH